MKDLGAKLRERRLAAGLSQRQLAKRAGLTSASISLIEQNRVSPTVASLKSLLTALSTTLAEFFAAEEPQTPRIIYRAGTLLDIGTSDISLFQVGDRLEGRAMQILHEFHSPGSDTAQYSHEGEEGGVVISGELELTVAGEVSVLRRGDAYYFSSRLPHRMRNTGKVVCEVVSSLTPPAF